MKPLAIVGLGAISVAGYDVQENWKSMLAGVSRIRPIERLQTAGLLSVNAGQIPLDDDGLRRMLRRPLKSDSRLPAERGELMLMIALEEALADAGIDPAQLQGLRVGILVGTSLCGFTRIEAEYQGYVATRARIRPGAYLTYIPNVCLDRVAYEFGIQGPRFLFSTACSASLHPFAIAQDLLSRKEIDLAIVGGTDPLSLLSLAGFSSLKSLAPDRCSPFSSTCPGISIGEGAGVLILQDVSSTSAFAAASKYPAVLGVSGTSDAYHPTASNPTGETIRACVERTLSDICGSVNVAYVMSHGTGTPHNDVVETRAIKQLRLLDGAVVSAAKSVVGHMLGASGAYETVMLVKAIQHGIALPLANFTEPRQGCDLDYVVGAPRKLEGRLGVKTAFAFGGNNVGVAIGPAECSAARANARAIEKIVITGMGIVSPVNSFGLEQIKQWQLNAKSPVSAIPPVRGFNRSTTAKHAAVVDQEQLLALCRDLRIKNVRKMDRISRLAASAAALALQDSRFKITSTNALEVGLVSASGYGALESVSGFYQKVIEEGARFADANVFPNTVANAHLGYVSIELKIKGHTTVLAQGSSSPYAALGTARSLLDSGMCQCVLVGAVSEYSETFHRTMIDLGFVSATADLRSYASDSRGNVCAEGAVFFFLEKETAARERGAKLYARVRDMAIDGIPAFPATYRIQRNPLVPILFRFRDQHGIPAYFAGEGNRLAQEAALEYEALSEAYPGLPLTSAAPYFGMASGVVPFYNMATFCLHAPDDRIPGVPHTDPSAYSALARGIRECECTRDCVIGTVSPGGSAGAIYLERVD